MAANSPRVRVTVRKLRNLRGGVLTILVVSGNDSNAVIVCLGIFICFALLRTQSPLDRKPATSA